MRRGGQRSRGRRSRTHKHLVEWGPCSPRLLLAFSVELLAPPDKKTAGTGGTTLKIYQGCKTYRYREALLGKTEWAGGALYPSSEASGRFHLTHVSAIVNVVA